MKASTVILFGLLALTGCNDEDWKDENYRWNEAILAKPFEARMGTEEWAKENAYRSDIEDRMKNAKSRRWPMRSWIKFELDGSNQLGGVFVMFIIMPISILLFSLLAFNVKGFGGLILKGISLPLLAYLFYFIYCNFDYVVAVLCSPLALIVFVFAALFKK